MSNTKIQQKIPDIIQEMLQNKKQKYPKYYIQYENKTYKEKTTQYHQY